MSTSVPTSLACCRRAPEKGSSEAAGAVSGSASHSRLLLRRPGNGTPEAGQQGVQREVEAGLVVGRRAESACDGFGQGGERGEVEGIVGGLFGVPRSVSRFGKAVTDHQRGDGVDDPQGLDRGDPGPPELGWDWPTVD